MPHLERHPWRAGDAVDILEGSKIVGRCEGINSVDAGRFHGFIIEMPHHHYCGDESCYSHCLFGKQFAAYWHKGEFHVEEIAREGERFICETCGAHGLIGVDGPLYGRDRDVRQASVSRCRSCTTQVE